MDRKNPSNEKAKAHNSTHKVGLATVVSRGGRETRGHGVSSSSKANEPVPGPSHEHVKTGVKEGQKREHSELHEHGHHPHHGHEKCGVDTHKEKPFITAGAKGIMEKSPYYSKLSLTSHSSGRIKKEPGHHFYRTPSSKAALESSESSPCKEKETPACVEVSTQEPMEEANTTYTVQDETKPTEQEKEEILDDHCYDLGEGQVQNPSTQDHEENFTWAQITGTNRVTAEMKSWASLHPSDPTIVIRDRKPRDQAAPQMVQAELPIQKEENEPMSDPPSKPRSRSVAQSMTRHLVTPTVTLWGDVEERKRLRNTADSAVPSQDDSPSYGLAATSSLTRLKNLRATANKVTWIKLWIQQILLLWTRFMRKHQDIPILNDYITNIEGRFGSGLATFFIFVRHLLLMDVALALLWILFVIIPQAIHADYQPVKDNFYFKNLLDGQNGMASSWFFYGNYGSDAGSYPLAIVYMVVVILTYFGGLFVVLKSLAYAIHDEGGSSVKDTRYVFSRQVLAFWDYALKSREAVDTYSRGIKSFLQDQMSEIKTKEDVKPRTKLQMCQIVLGRIVAWTITAILVVGGCAAIYFASSPDSLSLILKEMGYSEAHNEENLVFVYGPTVIFMMVNYIVPMCIYQLPKMEKYAHPKTSLHVNIGRVFILQLANVASLVVSTYASADETVNGCTGTLVGQQLYKLVILKTIVGAAQTLIPSLLMFYWTHKKREFSMAPVILSVIQRQALVWIGTLVCPVMPLLGVITMATMFFTNYVRINVTCHAPKQRWNQARRNSFLMGLTATTLFLILVPVSIIITRQDVISLGYIGDQLATCGPFSNKSMIQVAVEYQKSEASILANAMEIIFSSTIILPVILVMIALIYFQSLRVKWEKNRKKALIAELMQEREETKDMRKRLHSALNVVV